MKLHSTMTPQEWKDLFNFLTGKGALITDLAETDNNGLFVDYRYALIEYNGYFYYMQNPLNMFEPFEVTRYNKVSPYERRQNSFPREVISTEELLEFMNENPLRGSIKGTYQQWLFGDLRRIRDGKTDLWYLENELAGYREKDILLRLDSITTTMHTKDYHVLRFHSSDGNHFDYETKSRRITG